jgi:heat shock protein HtpX
MPWNEPPTSARTSQPSAPRGAPAARAYAGSGAAGFGRNYAKTAMLMAFLVAVLAIGGQLAGGTGGMLLFGGIGLVFNFVSYWFSDRIALMAHRARPVTREQLPELYASVERLTQKAGLPMPRLYVIPSATPNAFATGRNPAHAAVAVTEGILRILDRRQLEGVLAHELAHVKNRDILVASVAAGLAAAISNLANVLAFSSLLGGAQDEEEGSAGGGLLMMFLAPIGATLVQLGISRSREYLADETGAKLAGDPLALASALAKLQVSAQHVPSHAPTPATASLFIVNPFGAGGMLSGLAKLFSTHPPAEERIRRLELLARSMRGHAFDPPPSAPRSRLVRG